MLKMAYPGYAKNWKKIWDFQEIMEIWDFH